MSPPSLHGVGGSPEGRSAEELLEAHTAQLATVVDEVGAAAVAGRAGIDPAAIEAIADGDVDAAGRLDLAEAAAVLALAEGAPDAEALVARALEELLFAMTAAVVDVEVVAAELPQDLEPREVQGILEGRHPVSLREYATLQSVIESRVR